MTSRRWKKIGKIGKPYGLRGVFYVGGRSDLLPAVYSQVVIGDDPQSGVSSEIVSYRIVKDRALLGVRAIPDRTGVEARFGQWLWAPEEIGEHPYSYLLGRQVLDCEGRLLGTVEQFYHHGATDNVEIYADDTGLYLEIPFVDAYFHWDFAQAEGGDKGQKPLQLKVAAELFADFWQTGEPQPSDS